MFFRHIYYVILYPANKPVNQRVLFPCGIRTQVTRKDKRARLKDRGSSVSCPGFRDDNGVPMRPSRFSTPAPALAHSTLGDPWPSRPRPCPHLLGRADLDLPHELKSPIFSLTHSAALCGFARLPFTHALPGFAGTEPLGGPHLQRRQEHPRVIAAFANP